MRIDVRFPCVLALAFAASAAPLLASGESIRVHTPDDSVSVAFETGRVGWLAGDLRVSYRSPTAHAVKTFTIPKTDLTGFYHAHHRLLVYHSTLVDEREALLDLEYDYVKQAGTLAFRITPSGCAGFDEIQKDAGKVDLQGPAILEQHGRK